MADPPALTRYRTFDSSCAAATSALTDTPATIAELTMSSANTVALTCMAKLLDRVDVLEFILPPH